jgi:hypothetical protein
LSVCIAIKQHSCHVYSIFVDACALLIRMNSITDVDIRLFILSSTVKFAD